MVFEGLWNPLTTIRNIKREADHSQTRTLTEVPVISNTQNDALI